MKQLQTTAIVLTRTDFGEADRIVTFLTPDHGKLRLMARGSRKVKSKLAGGIELFSVSDIGFMHGRGDIGTLVSARLNRHYGSIIQDINRVQQGYDLIKLLHRTTEDELEADYFELLHTAFAALDNQQIGAELIKQWFAAQLLRVAGHTPNLKTDTEGQDLDPAGHYDFDFDAVAFRQHGQGNFAAPHIKTLRLLYSQLGPQDLARVQDIAIILPDIAPLVTAMRRTYLRA